jgi:plastocyanin
LPSGTTSVGTTVTFTATASGCPNPSYQFWIMEPGSGSWTLVRAYATSGVFVWVTTGQPAGTFNISVWARDASSAGLSSNASGSWDVYNSSTYVLTGPPPCTGVGVTSSPSGTALSGTTVTFTATASGCPNPSPVFQFWILAPGGSWTLAQAYSTTNTFAWNTTGLVAGTYYVSVRVRDASSPGTGGNSSGTWDAYNSSAYVLTVNPCTGLTVTSAPSGTALAGTTVIFTATGTCPHASPVYEFWILAPGATSWTKAQAYSTTNTFSWNTAGLIAGTYYVSVRVRDANSPGAFSNFSGTWDAYNSNAYILTTTPCASVSVTSSPSGTASAGTTVTFTATAMGCPHPSPVYEFWILAPGATSWTKVQAYSTTNTFSWVTSGKPAGTYNISVRIRDAQSTGTAGNSSGTWDAYNSSTYTLT